MTFSIHPAAVCASGLGPYLGMSQTSAWRFTNELRADGKLRPRRWGRKTLYLTTELDAAVAALPVVE